MSAVTDLVEYWNNFYKRGLNSNQIVNELLSPLKKYKNKQFGTVYHSVMDAIGDQSVYYPEPYFGFLEQMDPNHDVLGLFMNPGPVKHEEILEWNEEVIKQYTEWEPNYFLIECGVNDNQDVIPKSFPICNCFLKDRHEKGCNIWRRKRYVEIRRDFKLTNLRFLHTMEMFPFHSKVWDGRIKNHLKKIADLDFMRLTLNAVQELAINRKVKCILAVGQVWEAIFDEKIDWFKVTKKQFSGTIGVRVIHYQASPDSSPVIVMVRRTQNGVRFTENLEAQKYIRSIMGTEKGAINQSQDSEVKIQPVHLRREVSIPKGFEEEEPIIETILNRIPQSYHPELLTGKIYSPAKTRYKYIHLWYKNSPWHENYFSFHIHVYKGSSNEPKIEVRFGMNYKQLNLSKEIRSDMIRELTKIADNYDLKIKGKENVSFNIVRLCTGSAAVDEAALLLSQLFSDVKKSSDLIFMEALNLNTELR